MAEALRTPRGSDGACLFLKSGSACRRLGSSEATQGGGPRRKEGALLGPEAERELGKCCCSAGGPGLQAVRPAWGPRATVQAVAASLHTLGLRRPTSAACGAAGAGAWAAVARLRPARTAPRARSCVCSSAPSCLCSYAARSRPAHPGAAPGWEALSSLCPGYQRLGTATAAPARARETW